MLLCRRSKVDKAPPGGKLPLGVVIEAFVDDSSVPPFRDDRLLDMHGGAVLGYPVHHGFVERRVVARAMSGNFEPSPFLHGAEKLSFTFEVGLPSYGGRRAVLLHDHILGIELVDRLEDAAGPDIVEKLCESVMDVRSSGCGHVVLLFACGFFIARLEAWPCLLLTQEMCQER